MGDRLRDYGFMNPFRSHTQGSNYDASKAYLSGRGIDQWLTDVSTYNKVLTDFGIQSQIEYKQPDGSWGPTPPPSAKTSTITYISNGSRGPTYEIGAPSIINGAYTRGKAVETLPEYRWTITGDVDGANAALKSAGLNGTYAGPSGEKFNTGAYIPKTVEGKSVTATTRGIDKWLTDGPRSQKFYINTGDPLGAGLDGASDAKERFSGVAAPAFRYSPLSITDQIFSSTTHDIAKEFFSDPNVAPLRTDPTRLSQVLSLTPQIRDTIGTYINDTAAYWRSRDDGGGALGVIAKGLSGVAQFAGMASALHGITAGLGALTSGGGLSGAYSAGVGAAGSMPSIGSVIGNIAGNPSLSNAINAGIGAFTGGVNGGLPGGALGALTGYIGGVPGAILDSAGSLAGINQSEKKFDQIPILNLNAFTPPAETATQMPAAAPTPAASMPVAPVSSAGSVPSAIAASSQAAPQLSSAGLLGNLPLQSGLQQVMLSRPMQGGMLSSVPMRNGAMNPFLGGGIGGGGMSRGPVAPINQLSMLANLPQILARLQGNNPNASISMPTARTA